VPLGKAIVNALNLGQGPFPTVENYFLFIGVCATNVGTLLYLNTDSDLDIELGAADSELKRQVQAAKLNAGVGWACAAIPVADGSLWDAPVDMAMNANVDIECIVICTPVAAQADLTAMHAKAVDLQATYARRVFILATAAPINPTPVSGQSWAEYVAALNPLTDTLVAPLVQCVPYIYDDAVGILAGRLCNAQTSVADSPMRTATGSIVGQDQSTLPVDKDGIIYSGAHAKALNDLRFSVPAFYPGYPGVYWSDGEMLDVPLGDYLVVENRRVIDKAARAVYLVLIGLIANRSFNSSATGEAWAKSELMRPLRAMSKSTVFNGIPFPAEINTPKDDAITIVWESKTVVKIFMKATPFDSPKELTANLMLDLSAPA